MSNKNLEQRINIKCRVKIGKSVSETSALLRVAYDEYSMKKSSVSKWHRRFKEGKEDVQDDPRNGQPKKRKGQVQMWSENKQTMNQQCYLEVLIRLRESVPRKRPVIWPDKWILNHDNVPAHDALRFREFLAKKSVIKTDHPFY
jgi:transposase